MAGLSTPSASAILGVSRSTAAFVGSGSGFAENSIAVSSDNLPHVVYFDPGEQALKYVEKDCVKQPCNWDCEQTCPWSGGQTIAHIIHRGHPSILILQL